MDHAEIGEHLERLLAKELITDALLGYARGADRMDRDAIRSTFHPDAVADCGDLFRGTGDGFADFIGQVHPPMQTHTHHLSNISIAVDGDRAGSECYVAVRARTVGRGGAVHDTSSFGRYVDRCERREGTWWITHRRYRHSQDMVEQVAVSLVPPAGTRDVTDPSHEVLSDRRGDG